MKILVVDDEEFIRTVAKKILERDGHEIILAESGEEAVQVMRRSDGQIDLALVDLTMDGLSGADTIVELRKLHPGLPVIISSGRPVEDAEAPDTLVAETTYLQKPYRAKELQLAVTVAATSRSEA